MLAGRLGGGKGETFVDLYSPTYSLMELIAAGVAGFVAGRVTALLGDPRRREERQRRAREASFTARENLERLTSSQRADIEKLVAARRKIDAIREIRAALGIGLKEAKDVADIIGAGSPSRSVRDV